ncbi:hypothetical protein EJ08DRAFT_246036 [Tothia fuscella]|uniref:Uncharacterized protein n=1 Tax=Tothia fuscella TaxID=1048955 RepID=A0A9P4NRB1_9PEZI|nr:hypothetical protein EJ08DRAFT_246036 [Tothia fuscella]
MSEILDVEYLESRLVNSDHRADFLAFFKEVFGPNTPYPTALDIADEINEIFLDHINRTTDHGVIRRASGDDLAVILPNVHTYLWCFWDFYLDLVRAVPISELNLLVDVIQELKQLPLWTATVWGSTPIQMWADLPLLGICGRDALNEIPSEHTGTLNEAGSERWLKLQSFFARLNSRDLDNFKIFGVWMLMDVLEHDRTDGDGGAYMAAAVEWIWQAGPVLCRESQHGMLSDDADVTKPGSLYVDFAGMLGVHIGAAELGGLPPVRWEFWKHRFAEIADLESGNAAQLARMTSEYMEEIETEYFDEMSE